MLIPKDVQHHFIHGPDKPANLRGKPKRKLKQTLQTDNLNNAEHRKLPIIYFWQELIAKARAAEQGVILDLEAEVEKSQADFKKMGSGDIARQALAKKYFAADRPPTFGKGQDIDPGPMESDDEKKKLMVFGQAIGDITSTAEYVNQWADQHGYAPKVKDEAISFLLNHFCKRFPYFETIYLQSLKLWCGNVLHGKNGYKQWTRKTLKTKIGWANKLWAYCENLSITMVPNIAVATDVMPVASRTKSSRKKRNASYNSLSTQQCLQALDAAKATDDQQLEDLILLAMYTGCRLSELTHMKVEQVSKDRFTIEDSKRMLENAKFPSIQTFNKW